MSMQSLSFPLFLKSVYENNGARYLDFKRPVFLKTNAVVKYNAYIATCNIHIITNNMYIVTYIDSTDRVLI